MLKTSSKTPYEIRLELLQLSFEILTARHMAEAGKNERDGQWKGNVVTTSPTTSPTTEEVIAEAEKMNFFISKANHTN